MVAHYRYGESSPVHAPFKTAVAVNICDLCYQDTADGFTVKPASAITWTTDLPTTQAAFVTAFLGCAAQRYDGTVAGQNAYGIKDGLLRVDTEGVFEFDCASASFNVGDMVGPAKDTGNNLLSQTVVAVAAKANAIGRVQKPVTNGTKVLVKIFGTRNVVNN